MTEIGQSIDVEGLALAASQGDLDALGPLFEHYHSPLVRYLACRTQNNMALAEDVAATTWERVAMSIPNYVRKGAGFQAWLFTIARHALAAHYRLYSRRPECLDGEMLAYDRTDTDTPDELLQRKFEQHQIANAVNDLPAPQRRCVMLRFVTGLTIVETAAVMGKKPNAVKQLQLRALRRLGQNIGHLVGQDTDVYETVGRLTAPEPADKKIAAGGSA